MLSNLCPGTLGQSIQLKCSHYVWLKVLCRYWMFLLPGADIFKYEYSFVFLFHLLMWYIFYLLSTLKFTYLYKRSGLVFYTGGELSTGRIYTVLCEKFIWGLFYPAWKWDVQHLKGWWQLLATCILLFSPSWLNNHFIMSFGVWPFHTQSQKETYIVSLFPHPSKGHMVYWSLSCVYLPKKRRQWKSDLITFIPRPLCLIFKFSVICMHTYNRTRWHTSYCHSRLP